MSSTTKRRGKSRKASTTRKEGVADLGTYVAFGLIWLFVWFLLFLTTPVYALTISIGLLVLLFGYVAMCTAQAYQGRKLLRWQKGLVRLPLILVGGGNLPVGDIEGTTTGRHAIFTIAILTILAVILTLFSFVYWT